MNSNRWQPQVIGPHQERMTNLSKRISSSQMLEKIKSRETQNPLHTLVDKFRKQIQMFDHKVYPDEVIGVKLQNIDRLLAYNGRLAPLLSSLEAENNILRNELSILSSQLSKSLAICEQLVSENQQQKNIILARNEDIKKIIEVIALNETEARGELDHKNHLLQQENSILIRHLEQIKQEKSEWQTRINILEDDVAMWTSKFTQVNGDLMQALSRQQDLARRLSLMEQELMATTDSQAALKHQCDKFEVEANQLRHEVEYLKHLQSNAKEQSVTDKFEKQIANIINDYQAIKAQRVELVRENERLKRENESIKAQCNQLDRELTNIRSNAELNTSLLKEQKQKNANMSANFAKQEQHLTELRSQNDSLRIELDRNANLFVEKERMLRQEIEDLRREIDDRAGLVERRVNEIRVRAEEQLIDKQAELDDALLVNQELRRVIDRLKQR